MKLSKQMLRNWIDKIRFFFRENPKRAKLISFIIILAAIPLTVLAALSVQNLIQQASGDPVQIVDVNGFPLPVTINQQVYLRISLPSDWTASSKSKDYAITETAYAQGAECDASSPGIWEYSCDCVTEDGTPGHYAYRTCTNGGQWKDPTCYAGSVGFAGPGCTPGNKTSTPPPTTCGPESSGNWRYTCGCQTSDGKAGHYAIRQCNNGGFWQDPTCYEGTDVCQPTPTPTAQRLLRSISIRNIDTDGSTGGSQPSDITYNLPYYLNTPISWRLNSLLPGQNSATRVVQVTFFDGANYVPYIATVTLERGDQSTGILSRVEISFQCDLNTVQIRQTCYGSALAYDTANFPIYDYVSYEWGISSDRAIGILEQTQGNITAFIGRNVGSGSLWVIARQARGGAKKASGVRVISSP